MWGMNRERLSGGEFRLFKLSLSFSLSLSKGLKRWQRMTWVSAFAGWGISGADLFWDELYLFADLCSILLLRNFTCWQHWIYGKLVEGGFSSQSSKDQHKLTIDAVSEVDWRTLQRLWFSHVSLRYLRCIPQDEATNIKVRLKNLYMVKSTDKSRFLICEEQYISVF